MSAALDMEERSEPERLRPHVFNRVFSVPAGAPWEQARAAQLEARHGSPLAIAELSWRLRRLGSWRPGRPGRYVVFYVRTSELSGSLESVLEVEGQTLRVAFGAPADQLKRWRQPALIGVAAAITAATLAAGVIAAWEARLAADDRLSIAERGIESKARQWAKVDRQAAQERELRGVLEGAAPLSKVEADLGWATAAKAPEARINAVHWDHGLLAVEVRGADAPFLATDRPVERSKAPIRPGVWLWGVRLNATTGSGAGAAP